MRLEFDCWLTPRPASVDLDDLDLGPAVPAPNPVSLTKENWKRDLATNLATVQSACLILPFPVPPERRSLEGQLQGTTLFDEMAFVHQAFSAAPVGVQLALLTTQYWLRSPSLATRKLRDWLSSQNSIEWILFLTNRNRIFPTVHPQFSFALVVARVRRQSPTRDDGLTRLVNLAGIPTAKWEGLVSGAADRDGGESGYFNVLRGKVLDEGPWTYERFSRHLKKLVEDAAELGALVPLHELVHDFELGLQRTLHSSILRPLSDSEELSEGDFPVYSGRTISRDGELLGSFEYVVDPEQLDPQFEIASGDILVRNIGHQSESICSVLIGVEHLPAAFDHTVIRLRCFPGTSWEERTLLAAYLRSRHAAKWLAAHGRETSLTYSLLKDLPVPKPSSEMLDALSDLTEAKAVYLDWADKVCQARDRLFAASSFRDAVPEILETRQLHREMVDAGRQAGTFEYRVRNYFPHGIALRRELLRAQPSTQQKLDEILDCAEHFVTYLGILSLLNLAAVKGAKRLSEALNPQWLEGKQLRFDWGRMIDLIQRAAPATAKAANRISLPAPALGSLPVLESEWATPESELRKARNDKSHLRRIAGADVPAVCEQLLEHLDQLLRCGDFVADVGPVLVEDYSLLPSGDRVATFRYLQGASVVFRKVEKEVSEEHSRGALGILDPQQRFHSLYPWLLHDDCPECKRPETFVFNRLTKGIPEYVAMETGHRLTKSELQDYWRDLLFSDT